MTTGPRKDRLIQTRVDEELETALKNEATRRRLPVSQLVRTILHDTLHLVDGVVDGVDAIVQDSVRLAKRAGADAKRLVTPRAEGTADLSADLADVYAWNPVIVNQPGACSKCRTALAPGEPGYVGMRDDPSRGRAWLCADCLGKLEDSGPAK